MEIPIPNDWDGKTWTCVQVEWPSSPQYRGILSGLLTYLQRGRVWSGESGSITDAQSIGRLIAERNVPFTPCGGAECPETPESRSGGPGIPNFEIGALCGVTDECEVCFMASGPCPPIKIEDGKLYWWSCCEWVEVGAIEVVPQKATNVPVETPPSEYSQCGKIDAMATAMATIAQAVWNNKDGPLYFANIGAVDSSLPGFDVNNAIILALLSGARTLDDSYTESGLLDPDYLQTWRCIGASQLSTSQPYLTQSEYDTLNSLLASIVPSNAAGWWQAVMNAIGKNSLSIIAESGAANTSADCSCPVQAPEGFTIVQLQWDFSYFSPNTTEEHDVTMSGGTPLAQDWIAAVYDWEGLNDPNGEIKVYDQSLQVISDYSTGSGQFALYNNAGPEGQAFLDLFYSGVSKEGASDPTEYQDSVLTVRTSGNNVTVQTSGTLTLVYQNA